MRKLSATIEAARARAGYFGTESDAGNNGLFIFRCKTGATLRCIVSDGSDWPFDTEVWEHVSVSVSTEARCPTWEEMDEVRHCFWRAEETVIQIHPPDNQLVNHHPYVLHLWRPKNTGIPLPPKGTLV